MARDGVLGVGFLSRGLWGILDGKNGDLVLDAVGKVGVDAEWHVMADITHLSDVALFEFHGACCDVSQVDWL